MDDKLCEVIALCEAAQIGLLGVVSVLPLPLAIAKIISHGSAQISMLDQGKKKTKKNGKIFQHD